MHGHRPMECRLRTGRGAARPHRAARRARRAAGFTLVELLIVVIILGILAAIVIPQFTEATSAAREGTLKEDLRHMRTLVTAFRLQHRDTCPGYPNGDRTATPTETDFVQQMTLYSDENCTTNANKTMVFRYGPYFNQVPVNPLTKKSGVNVVTGATMPDPDENQPYGWIYNPELQLIIPNNQGVDSKGTPYKDL
jgi:general secretion pathway protein G